MFNKLVLYLRQHITCYLNNIFFKKLIIKNNYKMDNLSKHSVSLAGEGEYRIENINKIIYQTKKHSELLIYYLDYIRNYKELTEEMIENITRFDDNSKIILIKEYNIAIKSVNSLLSN